MTYISDKNSAPFDVFNQFKGTGTYSSDGTQNADYSLDALCGTKFKVEGDGREVVLFRNAATALISGKLLQGVAEVTAFEKMAMTVPTTAPATAGTFLVAVTNGATKMNINQFAGGFLIVASGTGIGQTLKIASHTAAVATSGTITVTLEDPIQVTLDATSIVSFVSNPYTGVKITDHSTLSAPIGASFYPVTASVAPTYDGTSGAMTAPGTPVYGLAVSHGLVGILVDSTVTNVGYPLGRSQATDGAVGVQTLTTTAYVGTSLQTLTSAQVGPVMLNL